MTSDLPMNFIQRPSKSRKRSVNKRLLRKSTELTKLYAAGAKVRMQKIKETHHRCSYASDWHAISTTVTSTEAMKSYFR